MCTPLISLINTPLWLFLMNSLRVSMLVMHIVYHFKLCFYNTKSIFTFFIDCFAQHLMTVELKFSKIWLRGLVRPRSKHRKNVLLNEIINRSMLRRFLFYIIKYVIRLFVFLNILNRYHKFTGMMRSLKVYSNIIMY